MVIKKTLCKVDWNKLSRQPKVTKFSRRNTVLTRQFRLDLKHNQYFFKIYK